MGEEKVAKLTVNQKRFVEEYCKDFNARRAAIAAGYSEKTAKEQGYENLTKPHIFDKIKERLDALTLSAEELTKKTADIAKGNLADYMTTRMVEYVPRVRKSLRDIISDLEFKLILQEEFCAEKGYTEDQYDDFQANVVQPIQDKILKYSIELKHNPNATRVVDGEPELIEQVEVDMPRLLADKERGIIKSFKYGKNGLEIELYAADAAMDRLMRVRGMFKDNLKLDGQLDINTTLNEKVSPEKAKELLEQFAAGKF